LGAPGETCRANETGLAQVRKADGFQPSLKFRMFSDDSQWLLRLQIESGGASLAYRGQHVVLGSQRAIFTNDGNGHGFVHSPGSEQLGFLGPSVLDPGPVPTQVITLLNTPVSSQVFHLLNP